MSTTRETYLAYLNAKIAEADWHGVSDVANDLRELEAEERGRGKESWPFTGYPEQWTTQPPFLGKLKTLAYDVARHAGVSINSHNKNYHAVSCWCPKPADLGQAHTKLCISIYDLLAEMRRLGLA